LNTPTYPAIDEWVDRLHRAGRAGGILREVSTMHRGGATVLVRCRFPTGKGNRVRVVIDGKSGGGLDCPVQVRPGEHWIRVTSWGLPLCGPRRVNCPAGVSVELALQVCLPVFVLGMALFVAALAILGPLAAVLGRQLPGYEPLVVLAVLGAAVAVCLLDFYLLLPAFSLYTFRLVETGELWHD
jgi:hypothetical protein